MQTADGKARAAFTSEVPVVEGHLHYTTDTGPWQKRTWHTVEARLGEGSVEAELPAGRPVVFYLSVTDRRDAMVSTEHACLPDAAG